MLIQRSHLFYPSILCRTSTRIPPNERQAPLSLEEIEPLSLHKRVPFKTLEFIVSLSDL